MKIVLANKYFYPKGGDCLYTLRLMKLLQNNGHTVIPFGMDHPQNIDTGYEKYFVPYIDFNVELKKHGLANALKVASRAVVNSTAAQSMRRLIDDYEPDIVHLQNIHHQLTPAIAEAAKSRGIPVVWTMHDYILACPNDNLLRDGKICMECVTGANYPMVLHRCKKGSFGASILAALERTIYSPKLLQKAVFKFICPSKFMAGILQQTGIARNKIAALPNFLISDNFTSTGNDYFLYIGRLTIEKGVDTLIDAFGITNQSKLIIAGEGPLGDQLKSKVIKADYKNISFVGHQSPENIQKLLAGCLASIIPSICYENFPYAVMESMAAGKPVIASRIGGIPEMIDHQINGLLFEPGNSDQLAQMIENIGNNKSMAIKYGQAGKAKVIIEYSGQKHYENLIDIYRQALGREHFANSDYSFCQNDSSAGQLIENMKG
jgi:glycosyltransferase involved in cell wall biosynthesis